MITDKQEMFNAAFIGLASQGFERSVDDTGQCLYRGPNKKKCAIGWCLTDEEVESIDIYDDAHDVVWEFWTGDRSGDEFYSFNMFAHELQEVHDTSEIPDVMEEKLISFATTRHLNVPSIGDE